MNPEMPNPVLIVDNSETVRKLVSEWLRVKGYPEDSLVNATNAQDARNQLEENPNPELIILDVKLEEDDSGITLLRELDLTKPDSKYHRTPVIVFTANDNSETRDLVMELGAAAFISKPTGYPDFMDMLDKIELDERYGK